MEYELTSSDIIEIIGIIASLITSIVAIVISIATLRQNSKMLKESTRPYVTIYIDSITICEQSSYFILKNFGNSPAYITDFQYDPILRKTNQKKKILQDQFDFVKGIILAPGQSKMLYYNVTELPIPELTFEISYRSGRDKYHESVTLNVKNFIHIPVARPEDHIAAGTERAVHTMREMLERTM